MIGKGTNTINIPIGEVPVVGYADFSDRMAALLGEPANHCLLYTAFPYQGGMRFLACIGRDALHDVILLSHHLEDPGGSLRSLTPEIPQLHLFEREIAENYDIRFEGHPWMKDVRFTIYDLQGVGESGRLTRKDYPFYRVEGEELHEVGVGPIHAGVIEPGHFRFICNGERVLHLEIVLGYQHRGVEKMLTTSGSGLTRSLLAESVAGDTAVGHSLAHAALMETLAGVTITQRLDLERAIGLELERIAVHIGDTAALCTDVAYQGGQVVCEALRTTIINTTQLWCGNRFGKGLVRPAGTNYPAATDTIQAIRRVLSDSIKRYEDIADVIYTSPSVLSRFDGIGTLTTAQAQMIGAVGMAARSSGLFRDLRKSHPAPAYGSASFEPVVIDSGDVLARGMLRNQEVRQSAALVREWCRQLDEIECIGRRPDYSLALMPDTIALGLAEGWRGEICHAAITDGSGRILHYKVKDPSFHNWMGLALAVRNQEISDFPVCNKSFNLSYCGHDL
ncbi:MAG: NADH-quinone oxidoreductase subunit C [Bacteroidales bacterium]